jgi:hypothetical protein
MRSIFKKGIMFVALFPLLSVYADPSLTAYKVGEYREGQEYHPQGERGRGYSHPQNYNRTNNNNNESYPAARGYAHGFENGQNNESQAPVYVEPLPGEQYQNQDNSGQSQNGQYF